MDIHTILVPTDFSTYAAHALQEALTIATRDKAQVLLLHVLPFLTFAWVDEWSLARPQFEDQIQRDAEQQLQTMGPSSRCRSRRVCCGATPRRPSVRWRKRGRAS